MFAVRVMMTRPRAGKKRRCSDRETARIGQKGIASVVSFIACLLEQIKHCVPEGSRNEAMSTSNATSTDAATNLTAINILTYAFLCVVTFGIGAAVHVSDLKQVWHSRKVGLLVGLMSQYLVMPAASRLVTSLLSMPDVDAFGVVLIGCCPGGATSNAFAYFAKADMALSVSMTAVSNALAFGTLPLLLFLWTRDMNLGSGVGAIPFLDIFGSLCMVLLPASVGVALRHKSAKWAKRAETLGAVSSAVLIASSVSVGLIQNASTLSDATLVPWKNVVAVALVSPIGMSFAAFAVWLQQLPACRHVMCRSKKLPLSSIATIVLETGIQNTVLALAIVTLYTSAWAAERAFRLQLIPILWGIFVSSEAVLMMFGFRYFLARGMRTESTMEQKQQQQQQAALAAASQP